jgi:hypothetical protein
MRTMIIAGLSAATLALAACGGQGDDSLGDNAAEAAENQADMLEEMSDNAATEAEADALEQQADAVEDAGEAREEAIDDADVNAEAMAPTEKEAAVNGERRSHEGGRRPCLVGAIRRLADGSASGFLVQLVTAREISSARPKSERQALGLPIRPLSALPSSPLDRRHHCPAPDGFHTGLRQAARARAVPRVALC